MVRIKPQGGDYIWTVEGTRSSFHHMYEGARHRRVTTDPHEDTIYTQPMRKSLVRIHLWKLCGIATERSGSTSTSMYLRCFLLLPGCKSTSCMLWTVPVITDCIKSSKEPATPVALLTKNTATNRLNPVAGFEYHVHCQSTDCFSTSSPIALLLQRRKSRRHIRDINCAVRVVV
jgi:hypothetical protein